MKNRAWYTLSAHVHQLPRIGYFRRYLLRSVTLWMMAAASHRQLQLSQQKLPPVHLYYLSWCFKFKMQYCVPPSPSLENRQIAPMIAHPFFTASGTASLSTTMGSDLNCCANVVRFTLVILNCIFAVSGKYVYRYISPR